ncbi:MAG: family 78 glycoside hydrolase catalytic domain [Planctomycetes bacterium]|nr:family 78 glycoside hydrolase catalytic domain [Planctomycetota bacterium]
MTQQFAHRLMFAAVQAGEIEQVKSLLAKKAIVTATLLQGLCVFCTVFAQTITSAGNLFPIELRCEYARNPVGVDVTQPHLSWMLEGTIRGQSQTAFQILVASCMKTLTRDEGDLWDSGKMASNETIQILYRGRPLKSSQQVFWKVRVWDNDDDTSVWSQPATFVTGLLSGDDWQAKWITANRTDKDPLPIFRKPVRLSKPVKDAIIHICGLGHYELKINGRRVGDYQMDPGWTNYRKTCLYSSYDVTSLLEKGDNVIAVFLGNGMYNVPGGRYTKFKGTFGPPKLICQMHVTFVDGSTRVIASDETWKYALGPIVFTCIYGGEDYDARLEQVGWDQPGFDDRTWSAAKVCEGPGGNLVAQYAPPIKVADYLPAVAILRLEEGQYEIDCGTNLSARPLIKVRGSAGKQVVITCAEKRGQPWTHNKGHVYTYTLKGQGEEVFRPRFTYFSFQYLYISGVDRPDDAKNGQQRTLLLEAGSEFLTSSAAAVGEFECSNALLNDINAMINRSVRSNLQSILTDCPHREKLGWLEVSHLMGPSIFYHRDVHRLYRKICRDTTESQLDNGFVPNIAPEYTRFKGAFFESPEWGSACVQLPNLLYKWYGDRDIEKQQYETMKRYVHYLASTRNEQGLVKPGLGDWYDWTPEAGHQGASQLTPSELPATAFLYDNARILNRVAERMGKKADAAEFDELARQVREDFIKAYYKPADHSIATGSQAALATALYFDLVPKEDRINVLANLITELEEAQYRQTTGEVCFRMLVQALAEGGRSDVVYRMINRTDLPGYGYMLKLGFKTLSERWDKPGSSMNHCMFGHIQEWFQNSIVGIRQAPDSIGFRSLLLRPEPVGDLTSASGHYDSIHGRIESCWRIEDNCFYWQFTVPPNTTAEVHVPATDAEKVTESHRPVAQVQGIVFLRMEPARETKKSFRRAVFKVGSGKYKFYSRF